MRRRVGYHHGLLLSLPTMDYENMSTTRRVVVVGVCILFLGTLLAVQYDLFAETTDQEELYRSANNGDEVSVIGYATLGDLELEQDGKLPILVSETLRVREGFDALVQVGEGPNKGVRRIHRKLHAKDRWGASEVILRRAEKQQPQDRQPQGLRPTRGRLLWPSHRGDAEAHDTCDRR